MHGLFSSPAIVVDSVLIVTEVLCGIKRQL